MRNPADAVEAGDEFSVVVIEVGRLRRKLALSPRRASAQS